MPPLFDVQPIRPSDCCDVDPAEVSGVEPDDDEGIEQVETDSWNNEQVHGGNVRRVVMQEGPPSLAGWPPSFDHVLGNARLRDLKPELEQFAVDAWRTPKRILHAHPPDQRAQVRVDLRSPSHGRAFKRQEQRKPALCQRTSVSGRMIVRTCRIDGTQRYSWIKNQRSLFVSRTRPWSLRLKTFN